MMHEADDWGVPKFSLVERDRRWKRVRELMAAAGMDAIVVPPNTGMFDMMQANARYLTGVGGNHSQAAAVFPLEGNVTAISTPDLDGEYWKHRQDWVSDIRPVSGWGFLGSVVERVREMSDIRTIGISGLAGNTRSPEGVTSFGMVEGLRENLPGVELVNANNLLERARFVKSSEEIEFLRAGVRLAERAIDVMAQESRPGVPENIVYARMIASLIEGGGELPSMLLWSAGAPQPSGGAYLPSRRPLRDGDSIIAEIDARWGGYNAQNTQPAWIGKVPREYRDMFAFQQEAVNVAYSLLSPGVTIREIAERVNALSNDVFDCRILLHGRGLGDDSPIAVYGVRNERMGDWVVEENSSFIVKPVVWNKDHSLRVNWGDTVVCTPSGAKRLGQRPPEIVEIT